MLVDSLPRLFQKLRLISYRRMFGTIRERAGSLSATEAFSADVIHLLGEPTLTQFADAIGVSQPNATYKVNQLTAKGYLEKDASETDRREVRLRTSEKFRSYFSENEDLLTDLQQKLSERFSEQELETADRVLSALCDMI